MSSSINRILKAQHEGRPDIFSDSPASTVGTHPGPVDITAPACSAGKIERHCPHEER
jgi:hypothetical protein